MAQRNYGQFFNAGHTGQSDEDDWRIDGPLHPLWRLGQFTIYWIPSENSENIVTGQRCIVSLGDPPESQTWSLWYNALNGIRIAGGWGASHHVITFNAYDELRFDLDGVAGTVTVSGALTGNGVATGDPWSTLADTTWRARVGGFVNSDALSARGWVSLPYARVTTGIGTTGGEPPETLTLDGDPLELDGDDLTLDA
jgi:hypothetical protein